MYCLASQVFAKVNLYGIVVSGCLMQRTSVVVELCGFRMGFWNSDVVILASFNSHRNILRWHRCTRCRAVVPKSYVETVLV